MRSLLPLVLAGFFAADASAAQDADTRLSELFLEGDVTDLSQFVWENRPVIVFADSPNDPNFRQQMDFLRELPDELLERDVVVLTDTDPNGASALRTKLRPRGFMMVLIGKDGDVKLRKPFPWDVRELSRTIDKMPVRQREIRERRGQDQS